MALRNLHYNYTATNDPAVFNTQLTGNGPWTFVVWNEETYDPPGGTYDNIRTYVLGGGKALVSTGNMELNKTAPLWATLGVYFNKIIFNNGSAFMYQVTPGHLVFNAPNDLPNPIPFNGTPVAYGLNGYGLYIGTGGNINGALVPTFTYPNPLAGNITFVIGNGGRTVFNGILPGTMNFTASGQTRSTAVMLWENEVCYIDNFYIPVVDFTANNTIGNAPLAVKFTDLSNGNITVWNWSFGDGTYFNTTLAAQRSPTHVYTTPGTYNVNLTVSTAVATVSTQKNGYITVLVPPSAGFNTTNYTDPTPLHPGVNVLVYSDQNNNTNLGVNLNDTAVLIALRNMHFNYTATNDPTVFVAQLNAPPLPNWSLVIWNEELYDPPGGTYDAIRTYIIGGGRALVTLRQCRTEQDRTAVEHAWDLTVPQYYLLDRSVIPVHRCADQPYLHRTEPRRITDSIQWNSGPVWACGIQPVSLHRRQSDWSISQ